MQVYTGKRYNSKEAAEYCGFTSSRSFVNRVKSGALKITYFQNGRKGRLFFLESDLDDYVASRRKTTRTSQRMRRVA